MELLDARLGILALLAATGYGVATIGMKLASDGWSAGAMGLIMIGFVAATQAEIILMRSMTLSVLYFMIIALETLIVLSFAFSIGEGLTARESVGGVLILAGLLIVSH
ncbi:5-aminolevulinate synthase [Primorskyibacter aestuariivivens]|uniref:5-aminolevulinate synthase n=1 Tax=Primorskyibacter aestuariivivens TaxID=1888912 RepID=UPI002301ADC4|nr:5-aminolevulinate synthase [Primorskyibacter aestuariivivens]MDA7428392.1 5-aminolevulinate synthase [Primorskyibacter aestuariivivens]